MNAPRWHVEPEQLDALRAAWDAVPNGGQVPTTFARWFQPLLNAVTEIVKPDHEPEPSFVDETAEAWMLTALGQRVMVQLARRVAGPTWGDVWLCSGCGRVSLRDAHYVLDDRVDFCEHCNARLGEAKWIGSFDSANKHGSPA